MEQSIEAAAAPVKHTEARHTAMASVADGAVYYDDAEAVWSLRDDVGRRSVRGAEQRTLRDLLDFGLIEVRRGTSGGAKVRATVRGHGALALWGPTGERLSGTA